MTGNNETILGKYEKLAILGSPEFLIGEVNEMVVLFMQGVRNNLIGELPEEEVEKMSELHEKIIWMLENEGDYSFLSKPEQEVIITGTAFIHALGELQLAYKVQDRWRIISPMTEQLFAPCKAIDCPAIDKCPSNLVYAMAVGREGQEYLLAAKTVLEALRGSYEISATMEHCLQIYTLSGASIQTEPPKSD